MSEPPIDPPTMSDGEYVQWLEAKVERLKKLVLTPGQFRALADFILHRGELTNAQGLTALTLRNMADEAAEAAEEK
jgi:hypothetical protein